MSTDTSPLLAASLVQPSGPQPSSSPLKTGVLKWWQLLFIGVGYVISGDYAGWQFGLLQGGWGGAVIAVAFCAVMYICLVLCLAELSTSLRASAFGIVKHSLGELPAIAASFCVALEYLSITATIAIFIGYYVAQLTDPALNSLLLWVVPPALYVVFGAVHMYGVGEATTLTAVLTAIALCGVVVFVGGAAPFFDVANLSVAACDPESTDVCDSYFPSGWRGVWNAIPYGTWFFLAIEGLPFAVDEAVEPQKSIPRALFGSLAILITTATCMVVIAPASSSAFFVAHTQAPLSEIMTLLYGPKHALTIVIATTGLIGLVASFSGAFYAYSRAFFTLAQAGWMPSFMAATNARNTPHWAIIAPGIVALSISFTGMGDLLVLVVAFSASVSYVLQFLAFIVMRVREPHFGRPVRVPAGLVVASIGMLFAAVILITGFFIDYRIVLATAAVLTVAVAVAAFRLRRLRKIPPTTIN